MSKQDFLARIRASRALLNEAISGLTEDQMTHDLVTPDWTVKDILAHIAAWQNEAALGMERAARGEPVGPLINESVDEWNAARVNERRRLPLVDVMEEFTSGHDRLLADLEAWPADTAPMGSGGWDETSALWWLTDHDLEHVEMIRAYRRRAGIDAAE